MIQEGYVRVLNYSKFVEYQSKLICKETLSGWGLFLRLAMPTTFLTCIEWWAFEIMVILAGLISVKHLAAMVVMMNINVAVYMIPLGVQYAVCGLVGKALGEDNSHEAKLIAFHSIRFCGGLLLLIAAVMNVWSEQIASVYTKDVAAIALINASLPYQSFSIVLDGINGI